MSRLDAKPFGLLSRLPSFFYRFSPLRRAQATPQAPIGSARLYGRASHSLALKRRGNTTRADLFWAFPFLLALLPLSFSLSTEEQEKERYTPTFQKVSSKEETTRREPVESAAWISEQLSYFQAAKMKLLSYSTVRVMPHHEEGVEQREIHMEMEGAWPALTSWLSEALSELPSNFLCKEIRLEKRKAAPPLLHLKLLSV